ncbi:hypothetical protein GCM10007108_08990 [Thermogymnomonas acidicola]|uniref:Uncharacterized protein n=1 Tax=Thermogymnomonas acidicola TaxID=399579 RepID=A0AA37F9C9_9ARCH|nr:hypothetical protein GCM10007108_08990 [Thermogymnomonas acidicola]
MHPEEIYGAMQFKGAILCHCIRPLLQAYHMGLCICYRIGSASVAWAQMTGDTDYPSRVTKGGNAQRGVTSYAKDLDGWDR